MQDMANNIKAEDFLNSAIDVDIRKIAQQYVIKALPELDKIPPSSSRDLLYDWANYMIDRNY